MCGLCGVLGSDHWAEREGGRRAHALRTRLAGWVLRHYGLELREWAGGTYVLSDRKGRFALAADLASLWAEAERLAGRRLDPLDPGLVAALR